jgi:hypothetical protein
MKRSIATWWARVRGDRDWRARSVRYFVVGLLIGWCALEWRVFGESKLLMPTAGAVCAALSVTRWCGIVWAAAGAEAALLLVAASTPLSFTLLSNLRREDALTDAPAVVVLGSSGPAFQERVTRGCELVAQGRANVIVLTRLHEPGPYWDPWVTEQVRALGLRPEIAVVGPVVNTHDEARTVAALAESRGWDRVILVTHAWHMPRAAAVFEKAGVRVIAAPCRDGRFADGLPDSPAVRVTLFGEWLRETVGTWVYRRRGWI